MRIAPPLFFSTALLILWEAVVHFFAIEEWILPAPSAIWEEWKRISPAIYPDIIATSTIAIEGLFIGMVTGVIIAALLHRSPLWKKMLYPLIVLSQNVPMIVLAPLLVMWFGFDMLPKLLVVALVCFFPITVATLDGFVQTDRSLKNFMKMAGASRSQLFWKVEVPSALPSFFSGCKLAATYSVMGAVIAEWLGAEEGIGIEMKLAASSFRTDGVFVRIAIIVILSFLLFAIIQLLESRLIRWNSRQREGER